jgi:hypothetical protein
MKLWEHTFAELVAYPDNEMPTATQPYDAQTILPLHNFPGFATARITGDASGTAQVLLESQPGGGWNQIGQFVDGSLTVYAHRQKGLGRALFLRCMESAEDDALPVSTHFTRKGLRLVRSAHKEAIRKALADGEVVKSEVLADYPDLICKGR